ncbi:siderophore-interacting protein [Curtobacterium sp. MCBA15_008]|uniref:siderophore-interacting protein n=1 Tax=Curtobacterium sp. MCBA15_008 TaxID=1898736 RepID=UPI0008DE21B0|nr:siderophore-interacting protein [Curtobacterium sp. MCBA15_008]OII13368.1 NADPH-dependent ferric siderophore reductase [Curtobacterium sp. MCBA15_008]
MSSKPKRPQHVFVVDRTERLSPHMVRVHLGGPAFDDFVTAADPERLLATDKYVKLLLAKPSLGLTPPYDLEALRETLPKHDRPARRTYTVRAVDHAAKTIAVDFVVHGDEGLAGPWAAAAQPGDLLALSGPGGGYAPSVDPAVTHVLLGDDSALPAISAALEALPDSATGVALVEVAGPADEQPVRHPARVDLRWLHRDATGAQPGTLLLDAARGLPRASRPVQVFAHGERTAMKAIRRLLQDDWGLEKSEMSLSAYWALGRGEDQFQDEKREPIGVIFTD